MEVATTTTMGVASKEEVEVDSNTSLLHNTKEGGIMVAIAMVGEVGQVATKLPNPRGREEEDPSSSNRIIRRTRSPMSVIRTSSRSSQTLPASTSTETALLRLL